MEVDLYKTSMTKDFTLVPMSDIVLSAMGRAVVLPTNKAISHQSSISQINSVLCWGVGQLWGSLLLTPKIAKTRSTAPDR
jgi:hypothetical protein